MTDVVKIDDGGYAFTSQADHKAGWDAEYGMTMREYYAAHCPMTLDQAHNIWTSGSVTIIRDGEERFAFMRWWAQMRFEYADAMIAESKVGV